MSMSVDCRIRRSVAGNTVRRTIGFASAWFVVLAVAVGAQGLPDLFRQAQQEFKAGHYQQSLELFDRIDSESRQPGFERDRQQLEAPMHFFRAANLAMLKKKDDAVDEFLEFLRLNPQAALKRGSFPRPVLGAFEEARGQFAANGISVAAAYQSFLRSDPGEEPEVTAAWSKSAVRALLSDEEKSQWGALATDADRRQFVDAFWKRLDPTPETPTNELRREFEARMRYADDQWSEDDKPGRDSDRGLVFALLGPPTSIDSQEVGAHDPGLANQRAQHSVGRGTVFGSSGDEQRREIWTYRGDSVPGYLGVHELRYTFFVRRGEAVLESSGRGYKALDEVAEHVDRSHGS